MEMTYQLHLGDCLDVLATLPDNSVDSIVTDPPYGLSFMGKKWDYDVPSVAIWEQCLRVLKPGGHLLAFAGTRTQHRMACRIEDAGFEIRDMIAWVYGSGFPKSLDVSKAIDKAAGAEREVIGSYKGASNIGKESTNSYITTESGTATDVFITAPATEAARQWSGWGTALKPALEPITMARKPLSGTVAETVLQHGTGAINVDGCRVKIDDDDPIHKAVWTSRPSKIGLSSVGFVTSNKDGDRRTCETSKGRWPANIIHDGSNEAALALKSGARFFYTAKAGKDDRNDGCYHLEVKQTTGGGGIGNPVSGAYGSEKAPGNNHHPTVKPTMLMAYLCRLVTPPGGTVLDPFMGSGSTGKAATVNGFRFIGIERDPEYHKIAQARISNQHEGRLL
jgi:site-specific DNA-methyltransferase (adenine-specific)